MMPSARVKPAATLWTMTGLLPRMSKVIAPPLVMIQTPPIAHVSRLATNIHFSNETMRSLRQMGQLSNQARQPSQVASSNWVGSSGAQTQDHEAVGSVVMMSVSTRSPIKSRAGALLREDE